MNNFLEKLHTVVDMSVAQEYIDFILSCDKDIDENSYTENHHILPRSLFPEHINDADNIIRLRALDHYKSHYILAKSNNPKMLYAFNMMQRIIPLLEQTEDIEACAKMYQECREKIIKLISEANTGRKFSEATRRHLSEIRQGKIHVREKASGNMVYIDKTLYNENKDDYIHPSSGRKHSDETIDKMKANSIKSKHAFAHKKTGKVIYRDKDFIDDDYAKGYKRPWATERFTGTKHWYNPETGEHIRAQDAPGESWIRKRRDFNNFFKDNVRVLDLRSGSSGYVNKSKRKPYEQIPNKQVICDIIDNRLFVDDYICKVIGIEPSYYYDLKRYISNMSIRSNAKKHLFDSLDLNARYIVSRADEINFNTTWTIEYEYKE